MPIQNPLTSRMPPELRDRVEQLTDPHKAFAAYWEQGMKSGKIPLEFAGPIGKEALEAAFTAGGTTVLIGMLSTLMFEQGRKGGEKIVP